VADTEPDPPDDGARPPASLPIWNLALAQLGRWADELDHVHTVPIDAEVTGPGTPASVWAVAKTAASLALAPVGVPSLAVAASRAQQATLRRIERFPEHLHALAEGRRSPLPARRVERVDAGVRAVVTSDLHRCIPGRLDWPERQGTKELYRQVLEQYADEGWHLVENGDVEDYWMVGGSTWGAVYDAARLAGGAGGALADDPRRELLREHLDRIVDNNAAIYRLLRDGFCADGRYHRTMGNHDDVYADAGLVAHLRHHLPGTDLVDTILLTRAGAGDADGIAGVDAVITHGHLTDAWNGPGVATLGRAVTWLATGLDDLPRMAASVDGLPDEEATSRLLLGRGRNRLITVDPRFGGNRRFDSLDEERLFAALRRAEPEGGWPWIVFGHTHFPMLTPETADGVPVRYANSGCGVLERAVTLLEWDPGSGTDLRLVLWIDEGRGPTRIELLADGPVLSARAA
jgi:hypothetical protein